MKMCNFAQQLIVSTTDILLKIQRDVSLNIELQIEEKVYEKTDYMEASLRKDILNEIGKRKP